MYPSVKYVLSVNQRVNARGCWILHERVPVPAWRGGEFPFGSPHMSIVTSMQSTAAPF